MTPEVRDAGLQASAVLRALLAAHRGSGSVETACAERACHRLQALGASGTGAAPATRRAARPSEAADAAVLPVGWRGQGPAQSWSRQTMPARPTDRCQATETTAREPIGRRQERQGRAGRSGSQERLTGSPPQRRFALAAQN